MEHPSELCYLNALTVFQMKKNFKDMSSASISMPSFVINKPETAPSAMILVVDDNAWNRETLVKFRRVGLFRRMPHPLVESVGAGANVLVFSRSEIA